MSVAVWQDFCAVAPSPELRERLREELQQFRADAESPILRQLTLPRMPRWPGFDDGTILPPDQFPLGTSYRAMTRAAAERAPLRGKVRVIVVLVEFAVPKRLAVALVEVLHTRRGDCEQRRGIDAEPHRAVVVHRL